MWPSCWFVDEDYLDVSRKTHIIKLYVKVFIVVLAARDVCLRSCTAQSAYNRLGRKQKCAGLTRREILNTFTNTQTMFLFALAYTHTQSRLMEREFELWQRQLKEECVHRSANILSTDAYFFHLAYLSSAFENVFSFFLRFMPLSCAQRRQRKQPHHH